MNNQYLEVLGLTPGATKPQIKKAYRQLSKRYHPDVNKDENAREKFIEINEAYKFLTAVGPRPSTIRSSAQAYDYDTHNKAYEEWRRRARVFAQKKAEDAARRQIELIKMLLQGMNVLAILVVSFNVLLTIDYFLPKQFIEATKFIEKDIYERRVHKYTDVIFDEHTFRLAPAGIMPVKYIDGIIIHETKLFGIPIRLDVLSNEAIQIYWPQYNIYRVFGYLIPILFIAIFFYKYVFESLENQLTIAIFFVFFAFFQFYIFLKF